MRSIVRRIIAFWTQERSLTALLVYLLISIFIWLPLSENEAWQELIQDIIFNLILLAGCFSVVTNQSTRFVLYLLAVNAFVFRALEYLNHQYFITQLEILMSAMYFTLLGFLIMRYVLQDEESTSYRIQGAIIVYVVFGVICALLYHSLFLYDNAAFNFTSIKISEVSYAHLLYFSFTVQTTVGPGDIFAVSAWAKSLVIFQSMFGMLFPVVIIARLVTLEIETTKVRIREKKTKPKTPPIEHHIATKIKDGVNP